MPNQEPPFDPNDARAVYDRISLTEEQLQHLYWMSTRRRDLRALLSEVVFFSGCLAGKSPRIDAAARFGLRHHIDETKLLMAALPARDENELCAKLAGLHERVPLVSDNLNLRPMLEAGARADISRLNPKNPPRWILDWALS
jgi:hypothetical protein